MVLPRQYVSGETQFYLGRRYVLKVSLSETQRSDIKLYRGKLQVTVSAALYNAEMSRQAKVKGLLKRWYAEKSQQVLSERISQMMTKTPWVKETPSFRIMEMKKQWGSCSASGKTAWPNEVQGLGTPTACAGRRQRGGARERGRKRVSGQIEKQTAEKK